MPQLQNPGGAGWSCRPPCSTLVLTYDPVNGRQMFVNGTAIVVPDPQKGGTIFQLGRHVCAGFSAMKCRWTARGRVSIKFRGRPQTGP